MMKKKIGLILMAAVIWGCAGKPVLHQETKTEHHSSAAILDGFVGSYYKGNFIWGIAMNLAWNELNENILNEKLAIQSDDKITQQIVKAFNTSSLSKNDLDEKSYYVKSGYGQQTVDCINRESRKKFPKKSFKDLKIQLSPQDIISYAYFLKEVEYQTQFEETPLSGFSNKTVKGFAAVNEKQRNTVKVLSYQNDDQFLIRLDLKNNQDQMFLAKGYNMKNPQAVLDCIAQKAGKDENLKSEDYFLAPNIHLDYNRNYTELIGKFLANQNFKKYFIGQMFENIKFDMDKKGARVENEAVITLLKSALPQEEKPRHFILDKPYWIIMKSKDSTNPYFILGINNTELMEVWKGR